jgi:hypothetical protein
MVITKFCAQSRAKMTAIVVSMTNATFLTCTKSLAGNVDEAGSDGLSISWRFFEFNALS